MSARVTRLGKNRPRKYSRGIIMQTTVWKNTLKLLEDGQEASVKVPSDFLAEKGLKNNAGVVQSFKASLKRYTDRHYPGKYVVYVSGDTVYATTKT